MNAFTHAVWDSAEAIPTKLKTPLFPRQHSSTAPHGTLLFIRGWDLHSTLTFWGQPGYPELMVHIVFILYLNKTNTFGYKENVKVLFILLNPLTTEIQIRGILLRELWF